MQEKACCSSQGCSGALTTAASSVHVHSPRVQGPRLSPGREDRGRDAWASAGTSVWWGVPHCLCCLARGVRWGRLGSRPALLPPAPSLSRERRAWRTCRPSVHQGPLPLARPPSPPEAPRPGAMLPARPASRCTGTRPRPRLSEEGLLSRAEPPWFCAALGRMHQPRKPRPPWSDWLQGDPPASGQLHSPHRGGHRVVLMTWTLRKF